MDNILSFNFHSVEESANQLASRLKSRRLAQNLTQEGLSRRSGVSLGSLRRFERSGRISLISFIRLMVTLRDEAALEGLLLEREFESLDDLLVDAKKPKRGRIK